MATARRNGRRSLPPLTRSRLADGARQWAYYGKRLFLYHDDDAPGDVEGDGEGGVWHVVK